MQRVFGASVVVLLAAMGGVLATGAMLAGEPASAQQTSPPVFEGALEMVNVTVTVHDAKGSLVTDLAAEDFAVLEDGQPQTLAVFAKAAGSEEREELTLNLGMLFDTSESMRAQLRLSQESAVRFLDAIPRAKDLLLVFFDRDIRISRYDSENQQGIFGRILETKSGGYTALFDAMAAYLARIWDSPGRKVLVLFTDGDDTTSRTSAADVHKLIRSSNVTIYPVAFAGEVGRGTGRGLRANNFLASIAAESGGQVFEPHLSKELAKVYRTILDELGAQYVLGYVPTNTARDGRYRRLSVQVKRPKLKARYRPGYDAPKDEEPKEDAPSKDAPAERGATDEPANR